MQSTIDKLLLQIQTLLPGDALELLSQQFAGQVVFSTSFSIEDQVIAHAILSRGTPISIFTLDTGRLFAETYSVWNSTNEKYGAHIKAYYPDHRLLEPFIQDKGPNSFYESIENRKNCCYIRKVEPLKRALKGNSVWVTGLRAEHSSDRNDLPMIEWDESNQIIKFHPLLKWTTEKVKKYISDNQVPYNPLHDKGFISIGCAPCTRAVKPGEDFRAGRWWWEGQDKKECGLHVHAEELAKVR
ncbi:MAG TPA: phosphoadenylyl-sulfate reductase [Flavitalea sp.]|nr:phosphoadenylyl-sulfate reductase [Flavitalea sp.]